MSLEVICFNFLSCGTRLAFLLTNILIFSDTKLRFCACHHHNKRLIFAIYASIFVPPVKGSKGNDSFVPHIAGSNFSL